MISDHVLEHLAGVFGGDQAPPTRRAPDPDSWDSAVETEVGVHLDPIGGRFRVLRSLGTGGMGAVYLAKDLETGAEVAVKVPHILSAFVDRRFELEVDALATVMGPAMLGLVARGSAEEPWLAMEVVRGESLARVLAERGALGREAAVAVARRLAAALAIIHLAGWVHRDIKPGNVVLTDEGGVRLVDFGLARTVDGPGAGTQTGQIVGTLRYLAPEQFGPKRVVDPGTDVFALGCVLFECATGRHAWDRNLSDVISGKWAPERHPALDLANAGLDDKLARVIEQLTATDPARRASDGLAALQLLVGLDPGAAKILEAAEGTGAAVRDAVACALRKPVVIESDAAEAAARVAAAAALLVAEIAAPASALIARCDAARDVAEQLHLSLQLERALHITGHRAAAATLAGQALPQDRTEEPSLVLVITNAEREDAALVTRVIELARCGLARVILTSPGLALSHDLQRVRIFAADTSHTSESAVGRGAVSFMRRATARLP